MIDIVGCSFERGDNLGYLEILKVLGLTAACVAVRYPLDLFLE